MGIPSDADMNNYTEIGNYYCSSSNTTPTLINAPFKNSAFVLKVLMGNGTNYPTQVYEELITGKKAYRCYVSEQGGWKDYVYFSDDATLLGQITNLKYKDINYGNVTISSNGYIRWSDTVTGSPNDQIDGTILFATIGSWGSNGGHCFNVNQTYCVGEANMTITNLNVRFWYIE